MVRRHCGLGVKEFRALSWGEQEIIREGLREEFNAEAWQQAVREHGSVERHLAAVTDEEDVRTDNSLDALSDILPGIGFNVRKV